MEKAVKKKGRKGDVSTACAYVEDVEKMQKHARSKCAKHRKRM
jgi:hypothetical protein